MIIEYNDIRPQIGVNVFIAPTAVVIGDVQIEDNSSIWFGSVIRGDMAPIVIGRNTNIQDNCTVHTDENCPARIGNDVTIGHNAVVHGCLIEDRCLIGISATILTNAQVKEGSIIAAGSVVIEGQQVGPRHLATGVPAKMKKELPQKSGDDIPQSVYNYLKLAAEYSQILSDK